MTTEVFDDGTIYTYQGDTILFNTKGAPTDHNYVVYFSVRDLKSDTSIIDEVPCYVEQTTGNVTVHISPEITDLIPVPEGKKFKDYRYSLKACSTTDNIEHTLQVGDNEVGEETKLRVFRKQAEGIVPTTPTESPTEAPSDSDSDSDSDLDTDTDTDTDTD